MLRTARRVAIAFAAILILGLGLRAYDLADVPPTGDEAESSINALTILQHGVPVGTYLGLPIYENTLTEPWPEHPEYEFRDSSYSRRNDLAIYHGWLPLYAIAGAQKLAGVTPDDPPGGPLKVRHDDAEVHRRVVAARVPSVVLGGAFLIFLFLCARQMFGVDAALAAMLIGAVGRPFVFIAREARYQSATLALTTGCCWALWRVYRYGRWRDYLLAAALLVLLFYTHLLGFLIAMAMCGLLAPVLLRRGGAGTWKKLAAASAVIAALCGPWVLLSGVLAQTAHIPPARVFLSFPADLIYYPILRIPYLILPAACFMWMVFVIGFERRLPRRLTRPLRRHHRQIAFLLLWIAIGFAAFTLLIPAASYFYNRMTLTVMGPGVVWGAMLFAAAARAWNPRHARVLAPLLFLAVVAAGNMVYPGFFNKPDRREAYDMVARLRQFDLAADTKLYCTPNEQLTLQYLTGLPIQSVAPVRKTFLDSYPGPILLIDSAVPYERVTWREICQLTQWWGAGVSEAEARRLEGPLSSYLLRKELAARTGAALDPYPPHADPPYADRIAAFQREDTNRALAKFLANGANNPMLRGYPLRDWGDWWPVFFYRFVEPERRMHQRLNYANRIRGSRAEVRDTMWVIYRCPPLSADARNDAGGTSHPD